MAEFSFEGEIESMTPRQLEFLSGVLQKRGLKGNKVVIETLGKASDNFIASVKKITTILDNGEKFSIIVKLAPTSTLQRLGGGVDAMFANECYMYEYVLPKFVSLQKAAGVPKEELFRVPECYGTLMEPMNELVLLEDLRELNFEMLDKFTPLTNETVRMILKEIAKLHSFSFVLKKQDPNKFDYYDENICNVNALMFSKPEYRNMYPTLETNMISIMDDDKYKKACNGTLSKMVEHFAEIKEYDSTTRYSVIIHGDCWTNNFMFQLKNKVPVEAMLIDYQMSSIGSPACDLLFMIFCSTDHSTRHQYYHEWIDYYHSELDKYLSYFGMNASSVYSRDKLSVDLRRHSKAFFATALFFYSFIIRNPEDAEKMKKAMENNKNVEDATNALAATNLHPKSMALFRKKVKDLVDTYIELGYSIN